MKTFRIISWNIDGIKAHFAALKQLVADHDPDILCLQKFKCSGDPSPFELPGYRMTVSPGPWQVSPLMSEMVCKSLRNSCMKKNPTRGTLSEPKSSILISRCSTLMFRMPINKLKATRSGESISISASANSCPIQPTAS